MTAYEKDRVGKISKDILDLISERKNANCVEILTALADDVVSQLRSFGVDY